MIKTVISLGTVKENKMLVNVKSCSSKFNFNGICINNKINSAKQTIFA